MRAAVSFVAATDAAEARAFYGDVLGLVLVEQSPYALVFKEAGHVLRVQIVDRLSPAAHTVHGWQVEDVAAEMADLAGRGVVFEVFDQLEQDEAGVWTTPKGDKIAWFRDPCGNLLSLTQIVG